MNLSNVRLPKVWCRGFPGWFCSVWGVLLCSTSFAETPPTFAFSIGSNQVSLPFYPQELGVDFNGKLYVSSQWHELKFDTNGALLSSWGQAGTGPGKFSYAGQAAFDHSDHVFIVDGYNARVQEFGTNGNFIMSWGSQLRSGAIRLS